MMTTAIAITTCHARIIAFCLSALPALRTDRSATRSA
jgi:hypothetical protein